jgi:26S proteasome regulatory subunit N11
MTKKHPQDNVEDEEGTIDSLDGQDPASTNKKMIQLKLETKSVTISKQAIQEITNFSIKSIPKEAIGLLSGIEVRPKELMITKGIYVTEGEEYSVSFSEEDFQVFDHLTEPEFCVGWWHSHPGFGLFLSQTDITTHIFSFQLVQPLSVALVVDPIDVGIDGIAKHRFFQVTGESRYNSFRYSEIASYLAKSSE